MKIEVSNGDIFDKKSILLIKLEKIKDQKQLKNIEHELDIMVEATTTILDLLNDKDDWSRCYGLYDELLTVNEILWDVEDKIREKESKKEFDNTFISLARSVYKINDKRSDIKKQINEMTGSQIIEEKSYKDYE